MHCYYCMRAGGLPSYGQLYFVTISYATWKLLLHEGPVLVLCGLSVLRDQRPLTL
jgi:hypothetical protein